MIALVSEKGRFQEWVNSRGILGEIAFVGMAIFQVVLALIPGEPLEIGAGYAFGAFKGTVLTMIGTVVGSAIVFYLVKTFGIKLCEVFFSREKLMSLRILKDKKKRYVIAFLVFFLPGTPKDLITYFLGLTDIKLSYILFLSGVARLPSVVTSTIGGDMLGKQKFSVAIIAFAIALLLSGMGLFVYKRFIEWRKKR